MALTAGTEASLTWAQALAWRLGRHLLDPVGTDPGTEAVAGVVRCLGAVLSMDESRAELAVRTRRTSSQPGELADAVAAGEVVKAFAYGGAVHHLAPDDAGTYLALRAAGRQWERASWVEHYRLTAEDWPDFRAAVREALADGPLTVVELGHALARHRAYAHLLPVFEDGAGTLVKPLTWQGDASIAPARDGLLTLQRLDTNPRWRGVPDLEDAGPRAITAYLRSYGPATPDHLRYRLGEGLSAGRARLARWWAGLAEEVVAVDVGGTTAYVVREDVEPLLAARPSSAVRLLPGHDPWVIGPGTKATEVTPAARRDLMTRKANPVVVGGVVRGTWVRREDDLTVTWLDDEAPPSEEVVREVTRLSGILGRDLRCAVVLG